MVFGIKRKWFTCLLHKKLNEHIWMHHPREKSFRKLPWMLPHPLYQWDILVWRLDTGIWLVLKVRKNFKFSSLTIIRRHSSSQQRLDQRFYALTLNFEIPQVAYFLFSNFCPWIHKKPAPKVTYLWQFGFFSSAALTTQNGSRLNIHIWNVSQDTSVV